MLTIANLLYCTKILAFPFSDQTLHFKLTAMQLNCRLSSVQQKWAAWGIWGQLINPSFCLLNDGLGFQMLLVTFVVLSIGQRSKMII